jgi:chromosomal replication initiation ATPase DnaA
MRENPTDLRILIAAEMFKVHPRDLVGPYVYNFLMLPRFALAKALRMRGLSTPAIGAIMNRDHTTIMYQLRRADYFMERYPEYRAKVEALTERFSKLIERTVIEEVQ